MARARKSKRKAKDANEGRINPMAEEALQAWTKIIAMRVRNELEDIHSRHISDDLMPDINRAIRRGIYLSLRNLFLMMHPKGVEDYVRAKTFLWGLLTILPDYWEDTELSPEDLAEEEARAEGKVLNLPKARQDFESWLSRHLFLWAEGQDLREETCSAVDEGP